MDHLRRRGRLRRAVSQSRGSIVDVAVAASGFRDPALVLSGIDVKADNGVIHTINRVNVPATI